MVCDDVEEASTKGTKERFHLQAEKGDFGGGYHGAGVAMAWVLWVVRLTPPWGRRYQRLQAHRGNPRGVSFAANCLKMLITPPRWRSKRHLGCNAAPILVGGGGTIGDEPEGGIER